MKSEERRKVALSGEREDLLLLLLLLFQSPVAASAPSEEHTTVSASLPSFSPLFFNLWPVFLRLAKYQNFGRLLVTNWPLGKEFAFRSLAHSRVPCVTLSIVGFLSPDSWFFASVACLLVVTRHNHNNLLIVLNYDWRGRERHQLSMSAMSERVVQSTTVVNESDRTLTFVSFDMVHNQVDISPGWVLFLVTCVSLSVCIKTHEKCAVLPSVYQPEVTHVSFNPFKKLTVLTISICECD